MSDTTEFKLPETAAEWRAFIVRHEGECSASMVAWLYECLAALEKREASAVHVG